MSLKLDPIQSLYFFSLIVMVVVTNVRPVYINYWNKTEYLINKSLSLNNSDDQDEDLKVWEVELMVANQIIITVLGKNLDNIE